MPFIPTNYAAIPPIGAPALRNFAQLLSQGMQMGALPGHLKRQAQQEELANRLSQLQTQYLPRKMEAGIGLQEAQRQKALEDVRKQQMISNLIQSVMSGGQAGGSGMGGMPSDLRQQYIRHLANLPSQTPEEKRAAELGLFKEKEQFREELKGPETQRFKTVQQTAATSLEGVMPLLDELIEMAPNIPLQTEKGESLYPVTLGFGIPTKRGQQQSLYKNKIAAAKDRIIKGLQLSSSDKTAQSVEDMIQRKPGESIEAYQNKLAGFKRDLLNQYGNLRVGKKFKLSPELLKRINKPESFTVKESETVRMQAPNGKIYNVPKEKIESYIKIGGKRV